MGHIIPFFYTTQRFYLVNLKSTLYCTKYKKLNFFFYFVNSIKIGGKTKVKSRP